jgi:carbonic anhydrase
MNEYKKLLLGNKAWVEEKICLDPNFFKQFEHQQQPHFLWIGCSDSRVPADEVTGTQPGEIFVHRNIANLVIHTDFNMLSVLEYAVTILKVKHVIVCGHYGCGGVQSALSTENFGIANKWLRHIKDIYRIYHQELEAITDSTLKLARLVELNIKEQIHNLAETTIIQKAWNSRNAPTLHGWVYDMSNGHLNELTKIEVGTKIEDIYMYKF